MGAVRVWRKVGLTEPPHLVLQLMVEPSKPRLRLDARFLKLWTKDCPFSLVRLSDVKSCLLKFVIDEQCDDKSRYDQVFLSKSNQ